MLARETHFPPKKQNSSQENLTSTKKFFLMYFNRKYNVFYSLNAQ
jgi:hypothetical protein